MALLQKSLGLLQKSVGLPQKSLGLPQKSLALIYKKAWICFKNAWCGLTKNNFAPYKWGCPKMVFGANLHLIGPFEAFQAGFCTEFCCASFVFLSPGAGFWTPGQNFGPRSGIWNPQVRFQDFQVDILARGRFWGPEKDTFARKGFSGEDTWESPTPTK